jgi:hypothetical protein
MRGDLEAAREEVEGLEGLTAQLQQVLRRCDGDSLSAADGLRLTNTLSGCEADTRLLVNLVDKYTRRSSSSSTMSWVVSGQSQFRETRRKLGDRRATLNVGLVTLNM